MSDWRDEARNRFIGLGGKSYPDSIYALGLRALAELDKVDARIAELERQLVETDTLVACLRGSCLMQNHLPALALEGEDFAHTFLRLTKASVERFRVRLATELKD